MMQMINGKLISRCVSLVAELGVADRLRESPKDADSLAAATESNPDALYRVLQMLAGLGIFVELPERQFENSPLSEVLRSHAGSVRNYARWLGHDLHWRVVKDLDYSVRTEVEGPSPGEPAESTGSPGLGVRAWKSSYQS